MNKNEDNKNEKEINEKEKYYKWYGVNISLIKFDYTFYKNYNPDLKHLEYNELINHYIKYGKKEQRIFCEFQESFDWLQYLFDKGLDKSIENNKITKEDDNLIITEVIQNIYDIWKHFIYNHVKNYNYEIKYNDKTNSKCLKEIKNTIEFNVYYYSRKYPDLSHLNTKDLYLHYNNHGRNERRIFTDINNLLNSFNFLYYYLIYDDLIFENIDELWIHYLYHGIKEKRYINFDTIMKYDNKEFNSNQHFVFNNKLPESIFNNSINNVNSVTNVPKTAIIYVFYNRPGELRNESNLAFFIRQTVLFDKTNIYLFIINGNICEVIFPQQNNLFVVKNRNCYDFEAYGLGINLLKQKFGNNLNGIHRIVTMNCSVTGPFYKFNGNNDNNDNNKNNSWLIPFENKLTQMGSFCCSNVLYRLEKINSNPNSNIRTPGYFNYFKNDINIINQLMNNVFIRHNTKENCIQNGEYGFAKILIKNNLKMTSIIDNYNKNIIRGWDTDRLDNLNRYDLNSLIFVKMNWRSLNGKDRECLPVKYKNIVNEIDNICKFNNPYQNKFNSQNINYNLININSSGKSVCTNHSWRSKQDFYHMFGKAEEFIIFPFISHTSQKIALYAHSDKENILRDYCLTAINTMNLLGYEVIILTTCRTFVNIKLNGNFPYRIIHIPEATVDFHMYKKYLNQMSNNNNKGNLFNYQYLVLLNDTIVLPIHGIDNMKNSIDKIINTCDYFGIWNSPEIKEHIISSFLHFKNNTFNYLCSYLTSKNLNDFKSAQDCEVNLVQNFNKYNLSYKTIINFKNLNCNLNKYQCPIFHPDVFPLWINKPDVFAIKWKYIGNYINKNKINNSYLNYLLRYIHFNHTGPKGKPELSGCYGNP